MSEVKSSELGRDWIKTAVNLVVEALAANPAGLTNAEVAAETGLDLTIAKQNGYITWTILQHLVETGRAKKDGRTYRAARSR